MKAWLLAFALLAGPAWALPEAVRERVREAYGEPAAQWRAIGRGEMRWLGISLYAAELWSGAPRVAEGEPYALALTYARSIPAERLIDTTVDELSRLGTRDETKLTQWRAALASVFPSVKPGETIVGLHLPGRGAVFYHQGRLTGEIADAEFARAFFGIWLDARTRAPALRAQLLGEK